MKVDESRIENGPLLDDSESLFDFADEIKHAEIELEDDSASFYGMFEMPKLISCIDDTVIRNELSIASHMRPSMSGVDQLDVGRENTSGPVPTSQPISWAAPEQIVPEFD